MKLLPATEPLESVAIGIMGELINTKRGNRLLLVINDRLSKFTSTVPLKWIIYKAVAQEFVHNWVLSYGPTRTVLSDNGSQLMVRLLTEVFRIIESNNVYKNSYHQKWNGQVERFHRTILSAIRCNLGDNTREWESSRTHYVHIKFTGK